MSTSRGTWRRRSRSSSACALLALALVGGASGTSAPRFELAFERGGGVWTARGDGSHARLLVRKAFAPNISPGGRWIAYFVPGRGPNDPPTVYARDGRGTRIRLGVGSGGVWEPDARRYVLVAGKALVLVDLASHARRVLARGEICCPSFSPHGRAVAFARIGGRTSDQFRSDVYVVRVADARVTRLTHNGHGDRPAWGRSWIAYRHFHPANGWTIGQIWLMRPDGSGKRLLAAGNTDVSQAEQGIDPVQFSADGRRLLGCLAHEFHCPPVALELPGGKRHALRVTPNPRRELAYGLAVSRDGKSVLVEAGGLETPHRVLVIPFTGGAPRVLVRNAQSPTWAR
jgi:dipeptidyl aminopeptidase/acylaminoacyl peptidase